MLSLTLNFQRGEYVLSPLADSVIVSASKPGTAEKNLQRETEVLMKKAMLNFFIH